MTLNANNVRDEYTASASQTVFNYTFKIYESTDLDVYVTPAGQECSDADLTTAYTVSGVGAEGGGTITLTTPAGAGDMVTIVSSIPTSRTTDYQNNGSFRPDTVNDDFDRAYSLVKQALDKTNRSLQFPACQQGVSSLSLPPPVANSFVRWKGDLSGLENYQFQAGSAVADAYEVSYNTVTVGTYLDNKEVADYTALRAVDVSQIASGDTIQVSDLNRGGTFVWFSSDLSTEVTADTQSGVYVAPNSDATGASGAWVRIFAGQVSVTWFGAVGDGVSNDTTPIQGAVTYVANNGCDLYLPANDYYVMATITIPEVAGSFFSENGIKIVGESRNSTRIITDQDIVVFDIADFTTFKHLTVQQTGTAGTGKAFFSSNQIRFCNWEDVNATLFKYGCLIRFSLWCSWRDMYFVNNTCGIRLSRNNDQENQANPDSAGSWNLATGWFHNQLTFDNILCNGGEVGIWASCMGATFNNVTCQNQETDGTTNSVLPSGEAGVGVWLEGGGATSSDTFNNVLINYYVEDTLQPLIIKEHRSLVIAGWFTQGFAGGVSLLDVEDSTVTISGQTGQTPGFANRIKGVNSVVCSHGELVASGASDDLTNTLYSPTGVMPITPKAATLTASPETSGTITLDSTEDQMGFVRDGNAVTFTGRVDISAISSPVGAFVTFDGLPFDVANLNERAGNSSASVTHFGASGAVTLPCIILENTTSFRVYVDASTLTATDSFYFSGSYFTDV